MRRCPVSECGTGTLHSPVECCAYSTSGPWDTAPHIVTRPKRQNVQNTGYQLQPEKVTKDESLKHYCRTFVRLPPKIQKPFTRRSTSHRPQSVFIARTTSTSGATSRSFLSAFQRDQYITYWYTVERDRHLRISGYWLRLRVAREPVHEASQRTKGTSLFPQ